MTEKKWITLSEAATVTGLSVRTIWRVIAEYQLDTAKLVGERQRGVEYEALKSAIQKRETRKRADERERRMRLAGKAA